MKSKSLFSPLSAKHTKIMLLGAGELGKEVIIEAMRMGFFTVAVVTSATFSYEVCRN